MFRPTLTTGILACAVTVCAACSPRPEGGDSGGHALVDLPLPVLLHGFPGREPDVPCRPIPGPLRPRSVTPAGGRLLALEEGGEGVTLLDVQLAPLASRVLPPPEGGSSIQDPVEAWLLGDTLLAVVDGEGRALHLLPGGMEAAGPPVRVPLPFHPHRAVPLAGGVAMVPLGWARGGLVHLWEGGDGGLRPLGVRPTPLPDARLTVLASALVPLPQPGGGAVFLHPVLVPEGVRVGPDGVQSRFPLTIPGSEAGAVGRVPAPPFQEEELLAMLAPALDAWPLPDGGAWVLTRSGRMRGGFREKAIVMLDSGMEPVGAWVLPVNAVRVVGGPGGAGPAVEDGAGRWHRCLLLPSHGWNPSQRDMDVAPRTGHD